MVDNIDTKTFRKAILRGHKKQRKQHKQKSNSGKKAETVWAKNE